jgi:hypothetical protein
MTTPYTRSGTLRGLVLATALSGTLLLLAGFAGAIWSGGSPLAMLTEIAAGVIGDAAWRGVASGPLLGLLLHFIVIGVLVDIYIVLSIRLPALNRHWRTSGVLLGAATLIVRSLLASPRAWPPALVTLTPSQTVLQALLHIVLLGLPVALLTRWAARWKA